MKFIVEAKFFPEKDNNSVEVHTGAFNDNSEGVSVEVVFKRDTIFVNNVLAASDVYSDVLQKAKDAVLLDMRSIFEKFMKEVEIEINNL